MIPANTFHLQFGTTNGSSPWHLFVEAATAIIHLAAVRTAIAKSPDDIQKGNWLGFSSDDQANEIETLLDYLGEPLGE